MQNAARRIRDAQHLSGFTPDGFVVRVCVMLRIFTLAIFIMLGWASNAQAANLIQSPAAEFNWNGAATTAKANVVVTRYERINFYRYTDTNPDTTLNVFSGNFASTDSLSGVTPALLGPLPPTTDAFGNPIALDQPIGLVEADNGVFGGNNLLTQNEPLFITVDQPILSPAAFSTRPDGRRYMAITLQVDDGINVTSHIITLVETSNGSGVYAGYFQPTAAYPIPNGATLNVEYDNYGEINDSNTNNAPSFVNATTLAAFNSAKSASVSLAPTPPSGNGDLYLNKEALRATVAVGDIAPYRLTLTNSGVAPISNVVITDTLPRGFRIRPESVKSAGVAIPTSVASDGRTVSIRLGTINNDESISINYVVDVTGIAETGVAVNTAVAANSTAGSNQAHAEVTVENAFFNDRAFLMGRVMVGECGDRTAEGLAGVRLYLEDGSNVITDAQGRWHLEGVHPGTHVLQVDKDSFSRRYELKLCEDNSRKAGNEKSRFIEVQGGTLWREDYWLDAKPEVESAMQQQLLTEVRDSVVHMTLKAANGETEFRNTSVQLFLPDSMSPVPGSARINGISIPDGIAKENHWLYQLSGQGDYWKQDLEVDMKIDDDSTFNGFQSVLAKTTGITARGEKQTLISMNQLQIKGAEINSKTLTVRPSFAAGSATLTRPDVLLLDSTAEQLRNYAGVTLSIVGHSDSIPMRPSTTGGYQSNEELSLARANSVAEQLRETLNLPANAITVTGAGAANPIASNRTADGRAQNRRVDVEIVSFEKFTGATVDVVEGDSGINTSAENQKKKAEEVKSGFNNIDDGMKVSLPVLSISATLDSKLKPLLFVNGEKISQERIGMTVTDPDTGLSQYTWVGVDLKETGDYKFEVHGIGPFGNARFKDVATITRTSAIKSIRVLDSSGNIADGKTPVRVKLELTDESGRVVESRTDLRLTSGTLRPLGQNNSDNVIRLDRNIIQVDSEGYAWFEPVSNAGTFRIRLAGDKVESDELEVSVDPYLRDWIMVGFAKGTVGYNTLSGNEEGLDDAEKDTYTDGETSFYARGRVKGDWLMTVAYDSRRKAGDDPHGQIFDPEAWYTLYGDDTLRLNDAPSQEKLYLRLERKDFYVLFGDYQTDLTYTELSRYQRALTGLKSEYSSKHVSANVFAAETGNGFIRDDIRGDGTSGLYAFSRRKVKPGTEQIRIEVRDRFTNEILSSESRTRFVDYSIDYQSGTVFFRQTVPVQDGQFNPVFIVAEYEVDAGEENITGGGRVSVHSSDRTLELGVTGVHEGTEGANGDLSGVDLTWKPNERHTVKAEGAYTEQQLSPTLDSEDGAWLLEHEYLSDKFDSRLRVEQQDGGFGLGQQAVNDTDIRQSSAQGRYRISETVSVNGEVRRQEVLTTNNTRDTAETTVKLDQEDWRVYGGVRSATDQVDDTNYRSDQVIAGAERDLLDDRLRLSAKGETSVSGEQENADYPKRLTLGADYRVNSVATVFTSQEMAWGYNRKSQETRTGVRATPWSGGTVTTEVGRADDEYGPRVFSHAGLYQTLQLNSQWSADLGFDRAQTLSDGTSPPTFDDRRPLASGTESMDYTAAAAGLGYRDGEWSLTNRIEFRHADTDDKLTLLSGFQHRLDNVNTIAGRFYYYDRELATGEEEWESQLDFSVVHRPIGGDWFVLNRTQLIFDGRNDANGDLKGRRLVNNTAANYKPSERQQLALNYGARYVMETIDSERYSGYTDLIGGEYRYNLTTRWDIGARGSVLHSYHSDVMNYSSGVMVGFTPIKDVWLSLGYNFKGFYDADFSNAESRVKGVVLDFRIKFDQDSFRASSD